MPQSMGATIIWICRLGLLLLAFSGTVQANDTLKISFEAETVPLTEPCTAMIRDIMATDVGRADLQCETPSGMVYSVPHVDKEWIEEKQLSHELISGYTLLDLPANTMIDATIDALILDAPPRLRNPSLGNIRGRRRRLKTADKASGKKTVLVVRVKVADSTSSLSENQLADDVFGDNGDPNNLRSQYLDCSYGKFELNKADNRNGANSNIRNGVVTVDLPNTSKNDGDTAMLNAINRELAAQFSTAPNRLADFLIYCLPPGVLHPLDIAYAYMDGYRSVYNDEACNQVSTQLHELGHNLNMAHSSMGNDEYGDKSGMMGYSYEYDDLPYMCFNAAKSWQLGWYEDKALRLSPSATGQYEFVAKLAGVADYGTTENDVVIKIEQEWSSWAYFINFNAGKGINKSTQYGKDRVLVTRKDTSDEANTSKLVARLKIGQNLKIRNFNGRSDEELRVGWASLADDVATLNIALSGPNVPEPSKPPSLSPSISPTITLSEEPSSRPPSVAPSTQPPSAAPSINPSSIPTPIFSEQPSLSQLPTLSVAPSEAPSTSSVPTTTPVPSSGPSQSLAPSVSPSNSPPSPEPSMLPSGEASQSPTMVPSQSRSPTSVPSTMPSGLPSRIPSDLPSNIPSQMPSLQPSGQPSFASQELESSFVLQLARGTDFDVVSSVCDALGSYIDSVTKSQYGNETETTVSCLPVVEATVSDNLFDRGTDVTVVTTTLFPQGSVNLASNATDFGSHVMESITSEEANALLPGIIRAELESSGLGEGGSGVNVELDDSRDTPVLTVILSNEHKSSAATMHTSTHLSCMLLPSLYLLFFL